MALTKLQREFVEHCVTKSDTGLTDTRWEQLAGLPEGTTKAWKNLSDFKIALDKAKVVYESTPSILKKRAWQWALGEAVVNYDKADSAERRQWWKLIAEMVKPEEESARIDYSDKTDAELWELICDRGIEESARAHDDALKAIADKERPAEKPVPKRVRKKKGE